VGAVDVRVRHDDNAAVAELREVEESRLLACRLILIRVGPAVSVPIAAADDACAKGRDDVLDLLVAQDLVQPMLLDIEDLAAKGQDRLELRVPAALRGARRRVTLHDEELADRRVLRAAVEELAR